MTAFKLVPCICVLSLLALSCGSRVDRPVSIVHVAEARPAGPSFLANPAPVPSASDQSSVQATVQPADPSSCPSSAPTVADGPQLARALAEALPGSVIRLAPATYLGQFEARVPGTSTAPITLCGPREAVIDGGPVSTGYALYLNGASWWKLIGFSVQGGQKGVVADHVDHVLISGLYVHSVGDEGIHLRAFSTDNVIDGVVVSDTGHLVQKFGEGIYVGSAHSNWCNYSGCGPDASDRNVIRHSQISNTTAENIDIKEGTTGGVVENNQFSGVGMVETAASAWVNVKGNEWTITGNTGDHSVRDGFQVHRVYQGWGERNVFRANTASVDGPGFGFYVQSESLGTVLACDNTASGAASGLSNVGCS